jgi:hypothetical protein
MSVVLVAATLCIALSLTLTLFVSRAVRVADARETGGGVPLSKGPLREDSSSRFVDPPVGASRGVDPAVARPVRGRGMVEGEATGRARDPSRARPAPRARLRRSATQRVSPLHVHWFRRRDDLYSGADLYACRCGVVRLGF